MSEDAIMKFILLVEVHFPRPKFNGDERREAVWMRSMREILSEFEPDVLAKASETIIRTRDPQRDGSMFPKPVECIDACRKIIAHRVLRELLDAESRESGNVRAFPAIERARPVFEIRPDDLSWNHWIDHLRRMGRRELVGEAESRKLIRASLRWPSPEAVIYEPDPNGATLLGQLPSPQRIPT